MAPDGKIVVVSGYANTYDPGSKWVYRFGYDGTPDPSFSVDGIAGVPNSVIWQEERYVPFAVSPQAGGKLVVAGHQSRETAPGEGKYVVAAYRFAADGSADVSFGPEGATTTEFAADAAGNAVVVQPDGRILIAGTAPGAGGGDFLLVRYRGDGGPGGGDDRDDQVNAAFAVPSPWKPLVGRSIVSGSDVDLYRVYAPTGRRIGFDVGRPSGSSLDSFLRVFDAAGVEIGSNDNAAAPGEPATGADSYVAVTFPAPGAYYVGVSSKCNAAYSVITGAGDATGATTGAYTLTLTERTPRGVTGRLTEISPVPPSRPRLFFNDLTRLARSRAPLPCT